MTTMRALADNRWFRFLVCLGTAFVGGVAVADDAPARPERTPLWSGKAPIGDGKTDDADSYITVHKAMQPNGVAVVICPGGGYGGLVTGAEGHGIATWLNTFGITGVVLEYRLPKGRSQVPLLDAQRAIRTVRANAKAWSIDPKRVGIMGFSAGGHLASTAATHFDEGDAKSDDPVARTSSRPDFAILVYPVITMGELGHGGSRTNLLGKDPSEELIKKFSNDQQVTDKTPPTFLAHAIDDKPVPPENSRMFAKALEKHSVPHEYLELPSGGHGLNGYKGPMWDAWQKKSLEWLSSQKILPSGSTSEK
jgi:acetyl esterase/lipase